jgi:putative membrane protein
MMEVSPRTSGSGEMIKVVTMMWWSDGGWGSGWWLLMSLMMVAFWGALIAVAVWAIRTFSTEKPRPSAGVPSAATDHAAEVLAERFARGEIEEDEFARRRAVLHQTRSGS